MTFFPFESFCSKARQFAVNLVAMAISSRAPAAGHPLASTFFGLVVPGGVDEVAAGRVVVVEDGEDGEFVDGS